jgi:HlyD family secretion protein
VRKEDRKILEGGPTGTPDDDQENTSRSADEKADIRRNRNRRHVWVKDGEFLRAVEVVTGLSDSKFTELVSGEIKQADQLVTGIQPKNW